MLCTAVICQNVLVFGASNVFVRTLHRTNLFPSPLYLRSTYLNNTPILLINIGGPYYFYSASKVKTIDGHRKSRFSMLQISAARHPLSLVLRTTEHVAYAQNLYQILILTVELNVIFLLLAHLTNDWTCILEHEVEIQNLLTFHHLSFWCLLNLKTHQTYIESLPMDHF